MMGTIEALVAGFLAGVLVTAAAALAARRRKCQAPSAPATDVTGTVPHTDTEAASRIGRETGGEVIDD